MAMITRRLFSLILTVSAFAALAADKTVTNKELEFELTFPDGWELGEKPQGTAAMIAVSHRAAKSDAVLDVTRANIPKDKTVKDHVDLTLTLFERSYRNFELLEKKQVKLAGGEGYRITFLRDLPKNNARVKNVDYFFVSNGRSFLIASRAGASDFDTYAKDIEAIANSFKVLEKK